MPWRPYHFSAYFANTFLHSFLDISTFETSSFGNISLLFVSDSQNSDQSSCGSFALETFQRNTLPNYGYCHKANRLVPSSAAFPRGTISIFPPEIRNQHFYPRNFPRDYQLLDTNILTSFSCLYMFWPELQMIESSSNTNKVL